MSRLRKSYAQCTSCFQAKYTADDNNRAFDDGRRLIRSASEKTSVIPCTNTDCHCLCNKTPGKNSSINYKRPIFGNQLTTLHHCLPETWKYFYQHQKYCYQKERNHYIRNSTKFYITHLQIMLANLETDWCYTLWITAYVNKFPKQS